MHTQLEELELGDDDFLDIFGWFLPIINVAIASNEETL